MRLSHFPGCCTAFILDGIFLNCGLHTDVDSFDFDYATDVAQNGEDDEWNDGDDRPYILEQLQRTWNDNTWEHLEASLKKLLLAIKEEGSGFVVATTTDRQTGANQMLERMGWYATPWGKKLRHTESELCVLSFKLDELKG